MASRAIAMRIKVLATVLLLSATAAAADSGVVIDNVPAGADRTVVMAVVHQALIRHGWTINGQEADAISASINGNKTDASIKIHLTESAITYESDATLTVASNGQDVTRPVRLPRRWLHTLQVDIGNGLATLPQKPST
jgi:ABC-type glycerol-3-phosphate transport system substrate-binding protein